MAHKLIDGNYRHKDVLIKHWTEPCSTGWSHKWEVCDVGNYNNNTNRYKAVFDTLKSAVTAIEEFLMHRTKTPENNSVENLTWVTHE